MPWRWPPVVLRPGGHHLMLIGLHAPLVEGDRFPIILTFEVAGQIEVRVPVLAVGAMGAGHGHGKTLGK